jgi:hypothetical protein
LAFQGRRVSGDREEQEDLELLGAVMTSEYQGAMVSFVEHWAKWVGSWAKWAKALLRTVAKKGM